MTRDISRRHVLAASSTTGVAATTAGCGRDTSDASVSETDRPTSSSQPLQARGSVPETADQAGIEALDEDGATIVLEAQTTYSIDDPPLRLEGDDLSILGSRSSVLRVPDGTIADDDGPNQMEIAGANVLLEGWTFDGNEPNQGASDVYSIQFQESAVNATIANMHHYNACGDAFGNVRSGTTITNCYATGFTEDGVDYWASENVVVSNCVFEGRIPIKIRSRGGYDSFGGLTVSNCALIGEGTAGLRIALFGESFTVSDVRVSNCRIERRGDGDQAVVFTGPAGTIRDVSLDSCSIVAPNRPIYCSGDVRVENVTVSDCRVAGSGRIDVRNASEFRVLDCDLQNDGGVSVMDDCTDVVVEGTAPGAVIDEGTRTVVEDRGFNEGDPSAGEGQWAEAVDTVAARDLTIEDTSNDALYRATTSGKWIATGE